MMRSRTSLMPSCRPGSRSSQKLLRPRKLRVRPPGIEWKTGQNPKMGRNWPKNRKWPLGPKWGKNGPEMAKKWKNDPEFHFFSPFLGHFFPISGRGPFSIFWPIFPHFWILARFPFYIRRPDSQQESDLVSTTFPKCCQERVENAAKKTIGGKRTPENPHFFREKQRVRAEDVPYRSSQNYYRQSCYS